MSCSAAIRSCRRAAQEAEIGGLVGAPSNDETPLEERASEDGRGWVRTSDLSRVRQEAFAARIGALAAIGLIHAQNDGSDRPIYGPVGLRLRQGMRQRAPAVSSLREPASRGREGLPGRFRARAKRPACPWPRHIGSTPSQRPRSPEARPVHRARRSCDARVGWPFPRSGSTGEGVRGRRDGAYGHHRVRQRGPCGRRVPQPWLPGRCACWAMAPSAICASLKASRSP